MKKILISMLLLVFSLSLVGSDIEQNHQHTECQECGKCIAEDCDGLAEQKCQGHQPLHKHTECQECGKCIAEDCNRLEEEKCQGHQVGHQHIECKVCGKCVDVECTGKENERCKKSYLVTLESYQYISFTDSLEDLQFYIIQDYSQYIEFIQKNEIKEIYYDEENNIHYNENIANHFTEEFFIDSALVLISYFTATSLDDLTVIKSYELENGILNIKFGVPKSDLIPKNNCYLVYMFKCDKHILDDFVTVEYKFGVKN